MSDRIDDTIAALRRLLRVSERSERVMAQEAGLSAAQLRVLQIVAAAPGRAATPTALAQKMGVSQATVTALVDKLAASLLVERQRSQTDRRQTHVRITDAGLGTVATAPDPLRRLLAEAFDGLEDWERSLILAGLERLSVLIASDLMAEEPEPAPEAEPQM